MKDWTTIRERYMRDSIPVRLGGLAANLRRIKYFASHEANFAAVEGLLDESKFFIEWTAREAEVDTAAELVELQIQLACWQRDWAAVWNNPAAPLIPLVPADAAQRYLPECGAGWSPACPLAVPQATVDNTQSLRYNLASLDMRG